MAAEVAARLQAEVLPLFRTRMDLVSWRNVRFYAETARDGLAMLEDAAADDGAVAVMPAVRKALTSTITACGRADDSNGEIQDVVAGLLALHAELCREDPPPPGKLVEWMVGFQFDRRRWHDFTLVPVDYADALGPAGLDRYGARLEQLAVGVPPEPSPEQRQAAWRASLGNSQQREDDAWDAHLRFALEHALQRVAVARKDPVQVVARYAGDGSRANRVLEAAEALVEIGATAEAIDYARRATFLEGGIHAVKASGIWAGLLRQHHPDQELPARREVFARFPSSSTAVPLHRVADEHGDWTALEAGVLQQLASSPWDLVVFLLFTLHDPGRAFAAAVDTGLPHARWNDDVWNELIDQQLLIDPASVIPVLEQQVTGLLTEADAHNYRLAAGRLNVLRHATAAAGEPEHADAVVAQLRQQHKNRPRLQLEFDRAHLPPLVRNP